MPHYTEVQTNTANSVSLVSFLESHGEAVKPVGAQHLWMKHQVWIRDNRWYTHYDSVGGYPIAFVMRYYGLGFQDAVAELLGCTNTGNILPSAKSAEPRELVVPVPNSTMNRVYAYLMQERFIDREVISFFAHKKTLYEDARYHNCIFVGTDEDGTPRHIHRRSTHGSFKQTEAGSKAEYSFHYDGKSKWLFVFEAPIDMLAFITLHQKDWQKHSYVALCSVSEQAVLHRLSVNKKIQKIVLCLDHDNAGIAACHKIKGILHDHGYDNVRLLHSSNKDWDEDAKALHGIPTIKAEVDETTEIYALCGKYIAEAKASKKPPRIYEKVCDIYTGIADRKNTDKEQIEKLIGLLLLLAKDEARKSLEELSWESLHEKLCSMYIPSSDNGNTEIRLRLIMRDMQGLKRIYDTPVMFTDADVFVTPILRLGMECIRLLHYLDRKDKTNGTN